MWYALQEVRIGNQKEFDAEINIHFPGLKNMDRPAVLVFPKLLVCPDCGFAEFTLRESEVPLGDRCCGIDRGELALVD